ncbi:hypothetical protein RKD18_006831 [Streptomyces phaeoluteigriseus]
MRGSRAPSSAATSFRAGVLREARGVRAPAQQDPVTGHDDGLRAVQGAQRGGRRLGQRRFGQQRELHVEDDPGRPAGHRGGGRARADAPAGPYRDVQLGCREQLLEQDEGAQGAGPAAALAAPRDQAVRPGADGFPRARQVRDLGEDAVLDGVLRREAGERPGGAGGQDHRVRAVGSEVCGGQAAARADPDRESARRRAPHSGQRLARSAAAVAEIEDAEAAGPGDREGEPGIRLAERGDADDHVLGAHSGRH